MVGLPHTRAAPEYSWCAYTQKVRRFVAMMQTVGYDVEIYDGEGEGTPDDIPAFDPEQRAWKRMNGRVIEQLNVWAEPGDFLCLIAGTAQQPIARAVPELITVEYGVGYAGTFADFRVFESYAWMHTVYGAQQTAHGADGHFYDAVIPNSYHRPEFPPGAGRGGYLLYLGRLIERKGIEIACETARRAGLPLLLAGAGDQSLVTYGTHVGNVGPEARAELLGGAIATLVPTLYVEPFGGVVAESLLCGTPVITTDWGAFTETVKHGVDGYRCRDLGEFEWAARNAHLLKRARIRKRALGRFTTDVVRWEYDRYFQRVKGLHEDTDFYTAPVRRPYVAT